MLPDLINIIHAIAELIHQYSVHEQRTTTAKFPLNTTETGSCMPNKFVPDQCMIVAACILYSDMEKFIPAKTSI
jgi:hypothetical protein